MNYFGWLPNDLLSHFIERYVGKNSEADFDNSTMSFLLVVLQFVNKRCYRTIRASNSLCSKEIINTKNQPGYNRRLNDLSMIRRAGECASIEQIEWLSEHLKYPVQTIYGNAICRGAALGGNLELMKWLHFKSANIGGIEYDLVKSGRLDVIRWAEQNLPLSRVDLICASLSSGKVDLIKYFGLPHQLNGSSISERWFQLAFESKNIQMVKHLIDSGHRVQTDFTMEEAARHNVELLQLLRSTFQLPLMRNLSLVAAEAGRLDVLEYLKVELAEMDEAVPLAAIRHCHIEVFQWALDNGFVFSAHRDLSPLLLEKAHTFAKQERVLPMFEFLAAHYENPFADALRRANLYAFFPLPMWRFLRKFGFTPNPSTLQYTIESTSYFALDVLRYFVEELNCAVPPNWLAREKWMRSDILAYLKEKKL